MNRTVVSKAEFAALKKRSRPCVTKWIKQGKISKAALVGEGNSAKIWVQQADADLAASLDPSQQLIQRAPVLPSGDGPAATPVLPEASPPAPSGTVRATLTAEREADLARRAKADADRAEQEAITAFRKNQVEEGRWMPSEQAAKEWAAELARFISETETFLATTLARALAEQHGLDFKALSVEIRNRYRAHRAAAADAAEKRINANDDRPQGEEGQQAAE